MPGLFVRAQLTVAFLLCSWLPHDLAAAERPLTPDDVLSVESFGSVRFDPTGRRLLFEYLEPFERQADFGRDYVPGQLRGRIYVLDLQAEIGPVPLFQPESGAGYALAGISSDGRYAALREASDRGMRVGIASLADRELVRVDAPLGYGSGRDLPWADERFALQVLRDGEVDLTASLHRENRDELVALWSARNRGNQATSRQVGSGAFASPVSSERWLGVVDAATGRIQRVAPGTFSAWFPSPDGEVWAALREQRLELAGDQRIENGANGGGIERRLVITTPDGPAGGIEVCPDCDVLPWSLNWSAQAPVLAFVGRDRGRDWAAARFRTYDLRTGQVVAIDLGTLQPHLAWAGLAVDIRSAWIGEQLAVLAKPPADEEGASPRSGWYLVGEGTPRNLTATFEGEVPQLLGSNGAGLLLLHRGEAWLVAPNGMRSNLTAEVTAPVRAWREPELYSYLPPANPQPRDSLVLEATSPGVAGTHLILIDISSRQITTITAPSPGATFVAVSPKTRRAAVIDHTDNMTTLSVIGPDGPVREVMRLNAGLRDVVGGSPVRIDHRGPDNDPRMSWLLLPPGYQPGTRVPTVVIVYPGSVGRETWSRSRVDSFDPHNDHILAARGYAVLRPSLPVPYGELPREPLEGLVDEVFAAVDASVAQGYVDAERLAVQGGSYGGYATGALVGLTDRFRSAIAMAGFYNLTSKYGQFDVRRRLEVERTGPDLSAASLMETGQGGMGAPPWSDPQRYLRNSPLMHVENVRTPIMLMTGDRDYVSTTQTEEFFTALARLDRDALMVRYYGEDHVYNSPANIRDMWRRIFDWYERTLGPPVAVMP
ncbi:S9 family peptidase [Sphingosinicella terrae]|uniref:S9 family peptidase n=1 Tax=Sphingosinicella terrae TaxID=2172047 RepID=UPI0013B35EBE|nr:prolyl oligopeptidase family serine peptidase [Sphingosinicella terrae]